VLSFTRNIVASCAGVHNGDLDWASRCRSRLAGQCLYVWFEAVTVISPASIEMGRNNATRSLERWWYEPASAAHTFHRPRNNIPFHTRIWPGQLLGAGKLYGGLTMKR